MPAQTIAGKVSGASSSEARMTIFTKFSLKKLLLQDYSRHCPFPRTIHFVLVNSLSPIGPRA
jgi:hypothetical protein